VEDGYKIARFRTEVIQKFESACHLMVPIPMKSRCVPQKL